VKDRRALGIALLACLDGRPPEEVRELLSTFDDDELAQLGLHAAQHRVVPFLAAAVRASGIALTEEARASLGRTHSTRTAEHLLTLVDLESAIAAFDEADVPFAILKGPVLAEHYYASADLRTYDDLDVLTAPSSFARAIDALTATGATVLDRNWSLLRAEARGQVHLQLPMGTLTDLHWHLVNRRAVREGFSIRTTQLLDRRRSVPVGALSVPTLDPIDMLLHVCLHASLSGGDRLIWLKDIERVIAIDPPDWGAVIERARSWRSRRVVAVAIERARRSLGVPVPDRALRGLFGSSPWRRVSVALDDRFPPERAVGRQTPATVWAQLVRDSIPLTASALAERAWRTLRPVGDGRPAPGILRPAGTAADRREFLRGIPADEAERRGPEGPGQ
jgi:hypothetical protein